MLILATPKNLLNALFVNSDKGDDTDEWALANNYVSVVPCQFDMTAHHTIAILNNEWDLEEPKKLNPKYKDN